MQCIDNFVLYAYVFGVDLFWGWFFNFFFKWNCPLEIFF